MNKTIVLGVLLMLAAVALAACYEMNEQNSAGQAFMQGGRGGQTPCEQQGGSCLRVDTTCFEYAGMVDSPYSCRRASGSPIFKKKPTIPTGRAVAGLQTRCCMEAECTETDEGIDFNETGTTTGWLNQTYGVYTDVCKYTSTVKEHYCGRICLADYGVF